MDVPTRVEIIVGIGMSATCGAILGCLLTLRLHNWREDRRKGEDDHDEAKNMVYYT